MSHTTQITMIDPDGNTVVHIAPTPGNTQLTILGGLPGPPGPAGESAEEVADLSLDPGDLTLIFENHLI